MEREVRLDLTLETCKFEKVNFIKKKKKFEKMKNLYITLVV